MSEDKPADYGAPPPYAPPTGDVAAQMAYPPPAPGFNPGVYPPQQPGVDMPMQPPPPHLQQQMAVAPPPQTITVTTHQAPPATTMVAFIDQCPNCKMGNLQEQFTPFGILCAIFFFPFGIICCLMSRHKICPVCGTIYHGR
ncbi:uncharacterized protein [Diadema antillarum]|uniref:uncharacterized protein n=1 Tax=Diadema antillarum TaxID=105358 RepID=UPI003A8AFF37